MWLRIHDIQEWPDYYDEANVEELRRFFDRYLKGADNGWEETPRVRYSVLDLEGGNRVNQPAGEFPPEEVVYTKYYLHGRSRTLNTDAPPAEATVAYAAESYPGLASFTNTLGPMMPATRDYIPQNSGQHVIHTGGPYASYLQLPIKAVR